MKQCKIAAFRALAPLQERCCHRHGSRIVQRVSEVQLVVSRRSGVALVELRMPNSSPNRAFSSVVQFWEFTCISGSRADGEIEDFASVGNRQTELLRRPHKSPDPLARLR